MSIVLVVLIIVIGAATYGIHEGFKDIVSEFTENHQIIAWAGSLIIAFVMVVFITWLVSLEDLGGLRKDLNPYIYWIPVY
jgi:uncharacterized membrane protein YedE/YeeE